MSSKGGCLLLFLLFPLLLSSQDLSVPVPQDYYLINGVSFSVSFLILDVNQLPGFKGYIERTGLSEFPGASLQVYSAEGLTSLNGKWRLGGYTAAGQMSSSDVTSKSDIYVFSSSGGLVSIDSLQPQNFQYNYIKKLSFQIINAGVIAEYVINKTRKLEFCLDIIVGGGLAQVNYLQANQTLSWKDLFSTSPVIIQYDTTTGSVSSYVTEYFYNNTNASAFYLYMQPAFVLSYLLGEKVNIRLSPFIYLGSIPAGRWKAFNVTTIGDSPAMSLNSLGLKVSLFFVL